MSSLFFPFGPDDVEYRKVSGDYISLAKFEGEEILKIEKDGLQLLAEQAFIDINHFLRSGHLQQLRSILDDAEASSNDRYVAYELLKNANIAAGGVLPMCQDTGTAIVLAKKGRRIWTKGEDEVFLSQGIGNAYRMKNLRYSQVTPLSMYEEKNTRTNLPAEINIFAEGDSEYKFLFMAKGGGSANKSFLYQATPSLLSAERLVDFLDEKIRTLGTSACPPYHLAIVIGGLSAEQTLKTVKLASARALDLLPLQGGEDAHAYRDIDMEKEILERTRLMGIGAQFGGKYFCHDVRVIRLPRHGASLPIGLGVSCSADRQALGKITKEGIFLETLERNPARFLPDIDPALLSGKSVAIDLTRSMDEIRAILSRYPVKTRISLTGPMIVARDAAHARLLAMLEKGTPLPSYFKDHPIYYAGPAKTPSGFASGSFGPTTAGRMDSFVSRFQAEGASLVMLAKGNRSPEVRASCQKYGGFYLGSIGGGAATLAKDCIKKVECIAFEDLGMEAIWRIEVVDFPAFIIIDDKGSDFFHELSLN